MVIAIAGVLTAAFTYFEGAGAKRGTKRELAVTQVAFSDLARRVARMEGERASEEKHCACVPRALPTLPPIFRPLEATEPEIGEEGAVELGSDALEEPSYPKPARNDPRVQRKLEEYGW